MELVSIDDIRSAAADITGHVLRTPLMRAPWDADLWLKAESLQPVGSFKLRGATHAVARLTAAQRSGGVVTHSSGNHGLALAHAATAAGVPCRVVVPEGAPTAKVDRIRAFGVEVMTVPPPRRGPAAQQLATETGAVLVPPFDDRRIIAGQGTIGLEIVADLPDVDVVLVPVGGGGLSSGVATAVRALRPAAAVIGVEPEWAADARDSLAAGSVVSWGEERTYRTCADGLRLPPSELTLAHLLERLDGIVTVTEDEIQAALSRLVRDARLVVEPSAAVSVAARLFRRAELPAGRTAAVVTGGNVEPAVLAAALADPS